jgi:hypothetical protein
MQEKPCGPAFEKGSEEGTNREHGFDEPAEGYTSHSCGDELTQGLVFPRFEDAVTMRPRKGLESIAEFRVFVATSNGPDQFKENREPLIDGGDALDPSDACYFRGDARAKKEAPIHGIENTFCVPSDKPLRDATGIPVEIANRIDPGFLGKAHAIVLAADRGERRPDVANWERSHNERSRALWKIQSLPQHEAGQMRIRQNACRHRQRHPAEDGFARPRDRVVQRHSAPPCVPGSAFPNSNIAS